MERNITSEALIEILRRRDEQKKQLERQMHNRKVWQQIKAHIENGKI